MADTTSTKKRGRPPLTDEQRKERNTRRRAMAVKRQQKYVASHPDKIKALREAYYEPKVRIPIEHKGIIDELRIATGLSFTELCLTAIEEKFNVSLHKSIDIDEQ